MADRAPATRPTHPPTTREPRRPGRGGGQAIGEVVAVLAALAVLAWGANALGRVGAESLLARNVQDATGIEARPSVEIHGWWILPQVLRGAYEQVRVTTPGITSGPLRVEQVRSELSDVRLPFHDVLVRDVRRVGIGRSEEVVTLSYPALNSYLQATGRPLRLAPAADRGVTMTGSVDVLDQRVPVTVDATLSVGNGTLRIEPQQITAARAVPGVSRLLLRQRLILTVPLGALPFGHELTGVRADEDGVYVRVEGRTVVLQP